VNRRLVGDIGNSILNAFDSKRDKSASGVVFGPALRNGLALDVLAIQMSPSLSPPHPEQEEGKPTSLLVSKGRSPTLRGRVAHLMPRLHHASRCIMIRP